MSKKRKTRAQKIKSQSRERKVIDVKKLKAIEEARKAMVKKLMENKEVIIDRNGSKLLVPKKENDASKKWMKEIEDSMEIYAVDNSLYEEGDVVDVVGEGAFTSIMYKNHRNPSDPVKVLTIMTDMLNDIKSAIHQVNFTSLDAIKKNLLPTFNGPDNACFIGKPIGGGAHIGFKFTLPNICLL